MYECYIASFTAIASFAVFVVVGFWLMVGTYVLIDWSLGKLKARKEHKRLNELFNGDKADFEQLYHIQ